MLYSINDPTKASPNLQRAFEIIDELPAGPDAAQAAVNCAHSAGQVSMLAGDYRVALEHDRDDIDMLREELSRRDWS